MGKKKVKIKWQLKDSLILGGMLLTMAVLFVVFLLLKGAGHSHRKHSESKSEDGRYLHMDNYAGQSTMEYLQQNLQIRFSETNPRSREWIVWPQGHSGA